VLNDPRREKHELIDEAIKRALHVAPLIVEGKPKQRC
jgi:hypothetical protein